MLCKHNSFFWPVFPPNAWLNSAAVLAPWIMQRMRDASNGIEGGLLGVAMFLTHLQPPPVLRSGLCGIPVRYQAPADGLHLKCS